MCEWPKYPSRHAAAVTFCYPASGLDLLRAFGNVTTSDGLSPEELKATIGQYDALIIRSASKVSSFWCWQSVIVWAVQRGGLSCLCA